MLPQGVDEGQGLLDVLSGLCLGVFDAAIAVHQQLPGDVVEVAGQVKLVVAAFLDVFVGSSPESEGHLVVAAAEELTEARFLPCVLCQIHLVGAVTVVLEGQVLLHDLQLVAIRTQWPQFHDTSEALHHDGAEQGHDAGELDDMVPAVIHYSFLFL